MKSLLLGLSAIFIFSVSYAQPQQMQRSIRHKMFGKDSINIHFDKNYFLIEDTCSSIIRYAHYNFQQRYFFGPFRDLNKFDPQVIVAEGTYTANGELDGPFILRYLNDTLQAKGTFKNGIMHGSWSVFYENGKPKMTFKGEGNKIFIENTWDETGKKIIDNGNGKYKVDHGPITWEGELVNGYPTGTWKAKLNADRSGTVLTSEIFKDGVFKKGSSPLGAYTDSTRISLISQLLIPVTNASKMMISKTACDPLMSTRNIVYASYKNGLEAFGEEIKKAVIPSFSKVNLSLYGNNEVNIEGIISEKGRIYNLKCSNTNDELDATALLRALSSLPTLEPALVDGKPVASGILINFIFNAGVYEFRYRILPPVKE